MSAQRWGWVSESPADFLFHGLHALHMRRLLTSWDQKGALHFRHARHPTLRTSRGGLWSQSSNASRRTPPSHGHAGGTANPKLSGAWAEGATARVRVGVTASTWGCCCTPCCTLACCNHGGRIAVTGRAPRPRCGDVSTSPKLDLRATCVSIRELPACPSRPAFQLQSTHWSVRRMLHTSRKRSQLGFGT